MCACSFWFVAELTSTELAQAAQGKTGVLFVCLGNICRSPTAEAVFTDVVQRAGCEDQFLIDSCGTGGGMEEWYKPGVRSFHEGAHHIQRWRSSTLQ